VTAYTFTKVSVDSRITALEQRSVGVDLGGVTSIVAGSGITIDQDTGAVTITALGAVTQTLSTLTQSGATIGQIAQWDGTAWVPVTLAIGIPSDFLGGLIFNFAASERTVTDAVTVTSSDNAKWINGDKISDFTITIPGSGLPVGFSFALYQMGAGKITVVGIGGATVVNRQGATKTTGAYAVATIKRIGLTSDYVLAGDVQ